MSGSVSATVWALTAVVALAVIAVDLAWAFIRRNRQTSPKESVIWTVFYITSALAFGIFLLNWRGTVVAEEYYATWVTQYPLSIDNLFVFIIILTRLQIGRAHV